MELVASFPFLVENKLIVGPLLPCRDMVDVTVYDPDMDGRGDETLLKIMCGAVNRALDVGGL